MSLIVEPGLRDTRMSLIVEPGLRDTQGERQHHAPMERHNVLGSFSVEKSVLGMTQSFTRTVLYLVRPMARQLQSAKVPPPDPLQSTHKPVGCGGTREEPS